jgi:protein-disulfide isomerase
MSVTLPIDRCRRRDAQLLPAAAASLLMPVTPRESPAAEPMPGERSIGAADAPVQIVEYASMTCPHCAEFHNTILPALKRSYVDTGKMRLIFRDFALDGLALRAAMLARCAGEARYPIFASVIYSEQQTWARAADPIATLKQLLRLGGLSEAAMSSCLADKALQEAVLQERLDGERKYGIDSTPSFVIAEQKQPDLGSLESFEETIEQLLKERGS